MKKAEEGFMEQVLLKLGQALLNGISIGRVEEDG